MSARLLLALWICSPIAIALILCAIHRKTLSGDPVDALLDEHAQPENRGIGGEVFNHYVGSNTDA